MCSVTCLCGMNCSRCGLQAVEQGLQSQSHMQRSQGRVWLVLPGGKARLLTCFRATSLG